ncbi:methylamine utilization protein [Sulfuricaulis sp.]|jgi:plastocyanin|uniref:methylamine utilization protein n=1 Tax=Sulfuricaulis sp. TaxID=2003553 RepID=UPI00355A02E0
MFSRAVCITALLLAGASTHAGDIEATATTVAGQPLADVAVVLEPVAGYPRGPMPTVTIAQRDRELIPYMTVVQVGTAIEFPNQDPFKHHLYSFSPPKNFEIKLYAGKPEKPIVFDKPGEVALGCNIHDWMEAYVLVVATPYFAKTDAHGRARIAHVPPGSYRLRWWHPRQKRELPARAIKIGAAPTRLTQALDVPPRIIKPKPPLDKDSY